MGRGGQGAQLTSHGPKAPFYSRDKRAGPWAKAGGISRNCTESTFAKSCLAASLAHPRTSYSGIINRSCQDSSPGISSPDTIFSTA